MIDDASILSFYTLPILAESNTSLHKIKGRVFTTSVSPSRTGDVTLRFKELPATGIHVSLLVLYIANGVMNTSGMKTPCE